MSRLIVKINDSVHHIFEGEMIDEENGNFTFFTKAKNVVPDNRECKLPTESDFDCTSMICSGCEFFR